jgi:hypothetical protein
MELSFTMRGSDAATPWRGAADSSGNLKKLARDSALPNDAYFKIADFTFTSMLRHEPVANNTGVSVNIGATMMFFLIFQHHFR